MAVNPPDTRATTSKIARALNEVRDPVPHAVAHLTATDARPLGVWSRDAYGGGHEYYIERRDDQLAGPGWRYVAHLTDGEGWRVFLFLDSEYGIHDEVEYGCPTLDEALTWLVDKLNHGVVAPEPEKE